MVAEASADRPSTDADLNAERSAEREEQIRSAKQAGRASLGKRLFRSAQASYRRVLDLDPTNANAAATLAALLDRAGSGDASRALAQEHFAKHPWERRDEPFTLEDGSQAPHLLTLRGCDKTRWFLQPNTRGLLRPNTRGGHFYLGYLLQSEEMQRSDYRISRGNLLNEDDLPPHDVLLNTIADADLENASLVTLNTFLQRNGASVVNAPDRVLETARDKNYQRFNERDGIFFAKTHRLQREGRTPEACWQAVTEMGFELPVIIREVGTHTARSTGLIETAEQGIDYFDRIEAIEFYVIRFHDPRRGKKYYNKKRMFCIDGALYPVVSHMDTYWNVRGTNRLTLMANNPALMRQEQLFLKDPEAVLGEKRYRIISDLNSEMRLDFWGIDFTEAPDETIQVFEANPCMRHAFDHASNFPYMVPHMQAISDAFEAMIKTRAASNKDSVR